MSQAGILNVVENTPSIPTQFDADTGFAVPAFNILNIFGGTGITTSAAGNTVTISFTGGGGFVTSVSGTPNRITSTGGTTPVIDIALNYVGQTSITTLGTITTGVWNGTAVGPTFGGTGQTTYTTGDILYASAANTLSKLPIGTAGQVLTVTAGIPSWQTDGGGTVTSVSGTLNRITSTGGTTPVIDIAATYVGQTSITTLGTVTTGTWNGTAIGPTFGGTGQTTYATGDILYASGVNTLAKLPAGTNGFVLTLVAGVPAWVADGGGTVTSVSGTANRITSTGGSTPVIDISASYVGQASITTLGTITTGVWNGTAVDATHGGTNQTTWATGDLLYASGANTLAKLAAGSNTNVLTLAGGVPTWAAPAGGGIAKVIRQVFLAGGSTTYTPSTGMLYCDIEVVSGGGGGGGAAASTTLGAQGGGGGGGGYARKVFTAATIGASQVVTVGAGGTAGSTGGGAGGTGGTTSVGSLISATGGLGGAAGAAGQTTTNGGLGGVGSNGDFNIARGTPGGCGFNIVGVLVVSGEGGSSFYGGGGLAKAITGSSGGNAGTSYGGGGSGGAQNQVNTGQAGGVGFAGIVIITEYTT